MAIGKKPYSAWTPSAPSIGVWMSCSRRYRDYGSIDDDSVACTDACTNLMAGPNADYRHRVAVQYLSRRVVFQYAPCSKGFRRTIQWEAGADIGGQAERRRESDGGERDVSEAD